MLKFDYNFIGDLTIEAHSKQDAIRLLKLAFESIGVKGDIHAIVSDTNKKNKFHFKIEDFAFTLLGESFQEVDMRILKVIKTICIEYHYDPVIIQTVVKDN